MVIVSVGCEEYACDIDRCELSDEEVVFTIEVDNVRYCATNHNKLSFYQVPEVPIQFKRFLVDDRSTSTAEQELERRILLAHNSKNSMNIPQTSLLEIVLRYLLSPFYLFQFFFVSEYGLPKST